jgi:hypothetical protein
MCFCCHKEGHVRGYCLVWKKAMEEEEKNSKLKVGINVVMVEWDQSIVDVCVTMQSQGASMNGSDKLTRKVDLMKTSES